MWAIILFALLVFFLLVQMIESGFIFLLIGGAILFVIVGLVVGLLTGTDDASEEDQLDLVKQAQDAIVELDEEYRYVVEAEEFRRQAEEAGARNEDEVEIFAKHIGVDPSLALKMYNQALTQENQEAFEVYSQTKTQHLIAAEKAAEVAKIRKEDREIAQEQGEEATICGREKYLTAVHDELKKHDAFDGLEEVYQSQYLIDSRTRANTHDPYSWGGMVDGLFGPGAGIATAMQTMEENAAEEQRAASVRENAMDNYLKGVSDINLGRRYLTSRSLLEETIREVESHIIDDDHADMYMDKLIINEIGQEITPGGSLKVKLRVETEEEILLLGKPAIIDGSIVVHAFVDEEVFATGYLNAPGRDVTQFNGVYSVGFAGQTDRVPFEAWVMLVPLKSSDSFTEDTSYELGFDPLHLWAIQR